ncbi:unnamed protein product, partial [Musa acuminata var. zebrina]
MLLRKICYTRWSKEEGSRKDIYINRYMARSFWWSTDQIS